MKTAIVIHKEVVTQWLKNDIEFYPSTEQKLLYSFDSNLVDFKMIQSTFETEIELIQYKTKKELNLKFESVVNQYSKLINPFDLHIKYQ
jgi:hypothetical protein